MRAVIQRVLSASVTVEGDVVSAMPRPGGLLVLVGVREGDTRDDLEWMSNKILRARLFPSAGDGEGGAGKPWDENVMQGGKEAGLPRRRPCPSPTQSAI
jgi:D-tyrosyl-tRNA(Tyr) deacylase